MILTKYFSGYVPYFALLVFSHVNKTQKTGGKGKQKKEGQCPTSSICFSQELPEQEHQLLTDARSWSKQDENTRENHCHRGAEERCARGANSRVLALLG